MPILVKRPSEVEETQFCETRTAEAPTTSVSMSISRKRSKDDGLSSLPDKPLLHILSFVDAKIAVQASVLGRRWRYLWTRLPVLNFNRDSFLKDEVFDNFVPRVLSQRDASADLHDLRLVCPGFTDGRLLDKPLCRPTDRSVIAGVLKRARPMGVRHLSIEAHCVVNNLTQLSAWRSLTTLELTSIGINAGFNLESIKELRLDGCIFLNCGDCLDPFRRWLSLTTLLLRMCMFVDKNRGLVKKLEISAPQLTDLTLSYLGRDSLALCAVVVISAPMLTSFSYVASVLRKFIINGELSFIEKVNIDVYASVFLSPAPSLIDLLEGMRCAKVLTLSGLTIGVLRKQAGLLKARSSPFTQLRKFECVFISEKFEPGLDGILPGMRPIPSSIMRYILGGSRRVGGS